MINSFNINYNTFSIYKSFFSSSNKLTKIICNVANKIFLYIHRRQTAAKGALLSYMFINTGVLAYNSLLNTKSDLNYCQEMTCALWNTTIQNRTSFLYPLDFRCNPSNANYSPFLYITSCLESLCHYAKNMDIIFSSCLDYKNNFMNLTDKSHQDESIYYARNIWDTVCPQKKIRHATITKEAEYINNCLENLCIHYNTTLQSKEKNYLSELCKSPISSKLRDILDRYSKLTHLTEKKLEELDNWTKGNIIISAIASVVTIAGIIASTYLGIITHRLKSSTIISLDIPGLVQGLRNILFQTYQTAQAITPIGAQDTPETVPETIAMNNLLEEARGLISDVSEVLESPIFRSEELQNVGEELSNIFSSGGVEKYIKSKNYNLPLQSSDILDNLLPRIYDFIKNGFQVQFIKETNNLVIKKENRTFHLGLNLNKFAETFIDDSLTSQFNISDISEFRIDLIKDNLMYWSNALCVYYQKLFCRLPLDRHNNDNIALLPNDDIVRISNNSTEMEREPLCYLFLSDIWCNWTEFFRNIVSDYSAFNDTSCINDVLILKLLPISNNKFPFADVSEYYNQTVLMKAIGGCYNQTILMKV